MLLFFNFCSCIVLISVLLNVRKEMSIFFFFFFFFFSFRSFLLNVGMKMSLHGFLINWVQYTCSKLECRRHSRVGSMSEH